MSISVSVKTAELVTGRSRLTQPHLEAGCLQTTQSNCARRMDRVRMLRSGSGSLPEDHRAGRMRAEEKLKPGSLPR